MTGNSTEEGLVIFAICHRKLFAICKIDCLEVDYMYSSLENKALFSSVDFLLDFTSVSPNSLGLGGCL